MLSLLAEGYRSYEADDLLAQAPGTAGKMLYRLRGRFACLSTAQLLLRFQEADRT